ncbi:MAG TPA: NAD(P)-dependent oxidoreductase [Pirellulales bacterium]|jgi:nucleoside-diphosphate-sugar epimerase|nr:NAD(P)-dependent oxidoreductase [Pirellulales bacterium]
MSWHEEFGDAFRGERVLVSGATGFIGRPLCEALLSLGADVHGVARCAEHGVTGVVPWSIDLREAPQVDAVCAQIRPSFIFHLAAQVTARQERELIRPMLEHNLLGSVNLLTAVMQQRCRRFVFVGSGEEPAGEMRMAVPSSPYTAAKTAASLYARMFQQVYQLPVTIVRPFLTYGPRQEPTKLIPYTIRKLLRGESPQLASANRLCDFIHVTDIVRGMLWAAVQAGIEGETFDLGTGEVVSIRAAVEMVARIIGAAAPVQFSPSPDRANEPPLIANLESSRRLLGWEPRWTLEAGLRATIDWYVGQHETSQATRRCA